MNVDESAEDDVNFDNQIHVSVEDQKQILLVHKPRFSDVRPLVNLAPVGLFAIADYLVQHGFPTEIIHEGVEKYINPNFDLIEEIIQSSPKIVGFSLSWHQQAHQTIETIRSLKHQAPHIYIVIGGFSASVFSEEIIESVNEIDFVIKGDAEKPFVQLCQALISKSINLSQVDNLVCSSQFFKANFYNNSESKNLLPIQRTYSSSTSYCADVQTSKKLNFTHFELMRNSNVYLKSRMDTCNFNASKIFYFSAGRGCAAACLYCGGAKRSFRKYMNRKEVLFFDQEMVISQITSAIDKGVTRWNSCYDPIPDSDYYPKLFSKIRQQKIKIEHIFDSFGLPSKQFIDEFSLTFVHNSAINLSPETGSLRIRNKYKTYSYDDDSLFEVIAYILSKKVGCSVYFSTGLPFEDQSDVLKTMILINSLKNTFPKLRIYVGIIDLEPGSILFDYSDRFGIKSDIKDFKSLLDKQKKSVNEVNYETEFFTSKQIQDNASVLQIEANCQFTHSNFYPLFKNKGYISSHSLDYAQEACSSCPHYKSCFSF